MRLIDADALRIDYIFPSTTTNTPCFAYVSEAQIANAPAVDAEPVRHGHWQRLNFLMVACSECRNIFDEEDAYCPHCGAKMDGGDEDAVPVED